MSAYRNRRVFCGGLIISIILTGLILIQRSEGGALGIGGGGGGGLMSGRSATTSIARVTAILGVIFLVNCLALSVAVLCRRLAKVWPLPLSALCCNRVAIKSACANSILI